MTSSDNTPSSSNATTKSSPAESSSSPSKKGGATCPVTGHEYIAPGPGDSRSPCPALNTMANHGYINRDGKNLSAWHITQGLKKCYGLTTPFSIFLSYVTFAALKRFRPIDLYEIGRHGVVEHNASLVHRDTPKGDIYAPIEVDNGMLDEFVREVKTEVVVEDEEGEKGKKTRKMLTIEEVGRARVRREKESPLDAFHAEIARGEVAIILGVWEAKAKLANKEGGEETVGARMDWIERWLGEERLPEGWAPTRKMGLFETRGKAKKIKEAAEKLRADEAAAAAASPSGATPKEGEKEK